MARRRLRPIRLLVIVAGAVVAGILLGGYLRARFFAPTLPEDAVRGLAAADLGERLTTVAQDLDAPWEVAFIPDGGFLVTERAGRLTALDADGSRRWSTPVPGVRARGEGGLLGLAVHPGFPEPRQVYLYLTGEGENRVERWTLGEDGGLSDRTVLLDGIPEAAFHDAGRIAFGPDGFLYVTTGDAGDRASARDPASLGGKILRLGPEGETPTGNPFGTLVWSLGHRNPQGLAWDGDGNLWATEHGRSGVTSGLDEVNRIVPGADYGWPDAQGDETAAGVTGPALHSGPDATWAPSGAAWWRGSLWFGGLRGQAVYEVDPRVPGAVPTVHLFGDPGRIRTVRVGPDGALWILTNNTDGRGRPRAGDDRLMRLAP